MRKKNILLISPVRNESGFIRRTIWSVLAQSVRPARWIIVDDGSSDDTASIVEEYAKDHDWIRLVKKPDRGIRAVGPGVVESFYYGLSGNELDEFEYVCKLDGDIEFREQYFEKLIEKFQEDPQLGSASGKPFILVNNKLVPERTNDEMVAGQINFYRVDCFKQIGGFVPQVHWDAIAFHRARMEGWRTQSFRDADLQFIHLRLMGSSDKGIVTGRMRWGKGQYFIGTHPLYLLGIGIYRSFEKPFLLGGAYIIIGYLKAFLERDKQYQYPGFRQSLHAWQMEKLKLGRRKEKINPSYHPNQLSIYGTD